MTLSAAIGTALSGLSATSRMAQATSSNLANALTPGYGVRDVALSADRWGGVEVSGITRRADPRLIGERRGAEAAFSYNDQKATSLAKAVQAVGTASDADSLSARIGRFEAALVTAAASPESEPRLHSAVAAARSVADGLNAASERLNAERTAVDVSIGKSVGDLSEMLVRVDQLNDQIKQQSLSGGDTAALVDIRQTTIDSVSDIVPIRELQRENGTIHLMTAGGQMLLTERPVEIGFETTPVITAEMSLGEPLSGLTIDGRDVDLGGGKLSGGRLSALFELRDSILPERTADIDALAKDIIIRFEALSSDETGTEGSPGLFTDKSGTTGIERGLAGRITLNPVVDPSSGGAVFRLRDGLSAPTAVDPVDGRLLKGLLDAVTATSSSEALGPAAASLGGHADRIIGNFDSALFRAEKDGSFANGRLSTIRQEELSFGVDSDDELQKLLDIERLYAANARVLQTADTMFTRLLEI